MILLLIYHIWAKSISKKLLKKDLVIEPNDHRNFRLVFENNSVILKKATDIKNDEDKVEIARADDKGKFVIKIDGNKICYNGENESVGECKEVKGKELQWKIKKVKNGYKIISAHTESENDKKKKQLCLSVTQKSIKLVTEKCDPNSPCQVFMILPKNMEDSGNVSDMCDEESSKSQRRIGDIATSILDDPFYDPELFDISGLSEITDAECNDAAQGKSKNNTPQQQVTQVITQPGSAQSYSYQQTPMSVYQPAYQNNVYQYPQNQTSGFSSTPSYYQPNQNTSYQPQYMQPPVISYVTLPNQTVTSTKIETETVTITQTIAPNRNFQERFTQSADQTCNSESVVQPNNNGFNNIVSQPQQSKIPFNGPKNQGSITTVTATVYGGISTTTEFMSKTFTVTLTSPTGSTAVACSVETVPAGSPPAFNKPQQNIAPGVSVVPLSSMGGPANKSPFNSKIDSKPEICVSSMTIYSPADSSPIGNTNGNQNMPLPSNQQQNITSPQLQNQKQSTSIKDLQSYATKQQPQPLEVSSSEVPQTIMNDAEITSSCSEAINSMATGEDSPVVIANKWLMVTTTSSSTTTEEPVSTCLPSLTNEEVYDALNKCDDFDPQQQIISGMRLSYVDPEPKECPDLEDNTDNSLYIGTADSGSGKIEIYKNAQGTYFLKGDLPECMLGSLKMVCG